MVGDDLHSRDHLQRCTEFQVTIFCHNIPAKCVMNFITVNPCHVCYVCPPFARFETYLKFVSMVF